MIESLFKTALAALLGCFLVGTTIHAQQVQKPATAKKEATDKKPTAGPFHAKLAAIDKTAKTITVGKRTFQITSETKIFRAGKPAKLEDGVIGEEVSGYIKPADDGKLIATKVNFGPKEAKTAKASEKKKEK